MVSTSIDEASIKAKKVVELQNEIEKCRELQISCKKANDNIGDKIWADHIKKLKAEKHVLDSSIKYTNLTLFCQAVKGYLTKAQYEECWRKVDDMLLNPEKHFFKEKNYLED